MSIDLRYGILEQDMGLVGVRPQAGDIGLFDPFIIKRGVKESSVLWERLRRSDEHRMPPVGLLQPDPLGVEIVGSWIDRK